jgi:hypothetical protein
MRGIAVRPPNQRDILESAIDLMCSQGQRIPQIALSPAVEYAMQLLVSTHARRPCLASGQIDQRSGQPELKQFPASDDPAIGIVFGLKLPITVSRLVGNVS